MSSSDASPSEGFEEALENLDFEAARRLADQAEGPERERLRERVRTAREEAGKRAEKLAARIQSMARADHYEGLLALAADPATEPLLALASPELERGAKLHLDGAARRRKRFRAAAERHMKSAAEALVFLDDSKALSEIGKVDPRWLTEEQREQLAALKSQAEQAGKERREIEHRTAAVLREHHPEPPPESSRRPRKSKGCLGSALAALALITAAAAAALLALRPPSSRRRP